MYSPDRPYWFRFFLLALLPAAAMAQLAAGNPDWQETVAPPPPEFNQTRLVPFEVSAASSLRFGVDSATIKITPDGIVRYVVVASSASGALNAMYEGVRCATGEVKTYARLIPGGGWKLLQDVEWKPLDLGTISRHSAALAKQGLCKGGNAPQASVDIIVRTLKGTLQQSNN